MSTPEFDIRQLDKEVKNEGLVINVMKMIGWKDFVPEKFWEIFTKDGIDQIRLTQIIEQELKKAKR